MKWPSLLIEHMSLRLKRKNNKENRMQPIGSIVYLKNGHRKLMITNRVPIVNLGDGEVYFDYAACLYPIDYIIKKG